MNEMSAAVELSLDWEELFGAEMPEEKTHVGSISDGLILSLSNLGRVDIEYIASVTGEDYKTVINTLKGSIYQNPLTWEECCYKGWETAEEYLSGNLMRKLETARRANKKYNGYFEDNIAAIQKVIPPAVDAKDIYITLGSPWVPPDIIDEFVDYLFSEQGRSWWSPLLRESGPRTFRDELTGTWEIPYKSMYSYNVKNTQTYGTSRITALQILERTLNMKNVVVTDEVKCNATASGKKRVVNQAETTLALEKQRNLIEMFQKWVWRNEKRKKRLETIFENQYACVRRRMFDGSFLRFPGMSGSVKLYPYQKNAVARILFTPNTLLAHDVGSGKTYVMAAAGMEMMRMGMSKKNLFVVPNDIVGQWRAIFSEMYPEARLLVVEPKSFKPAKRQEVLARMRDGEFDGIIIAYSCFEQIPLSRAYYRQSLVDEKKAIERTVEKNHRWTSRLNTKYEAIKKALADLDTNPKNKYNGVCFDELGITRLFVDEAHNFKNVPVETRTSNVLGISAVGSKKCQEMMDKVRMVQKQNDGAGVVFATGTPITNSITEVFVLQKYLQSGELAMLDLQNFDSWVGMFAEKNTDFEIDVDTNSYRLATRFSKFHNLPELTTLLASIADFHQVDASAGIPEMDGYSDSLISKTLELAAYLHVISERADDVRKGYVSRKDDNLLKITTDGRKAALDMRLIDPVYGFTSQSKVARCVENVVNIYDKTAAIRGVQLIFCDSSTPKAEFNIYDEIKRLLRENGIRGEEIAYVHDAHTEAQRNALFARVREGEIRIILGSTFKLGLGVNVQDRLIALHHVDVPWRPADMTQREGRILRQGNRNRKVWIFRYITEGSFDAYSWQLLETKQRFITDLLSGSLVERSGSDIDDTVLNYAEVKALAVGNPLVKERVETANELSRYKTLQRKLVESRLTLEKELLEIPARIAEQEDLMKKCETDFLYYTRWKEWNPAPEDSADKKEEAEKRRKLREIIHCNLKEHTLEPQEKPLLVYRGFQLILPANMKPEKPFVWLKRTGKYYVELGDKETGNLIRIDNFLDNLEEHLNKLKAGRDRLRTREDQIREELAGNESYSEQIDEYRKKLEEIDKKLGVEKK